MLLDGFGDVTLSGSALVLQMGTHLVNAGGYEFVPPFHGFDSTHIYGSYDGRMIFLEVR